ncbi:MAG: 2-C-methyl-D-erythritol 4-phosphate cytidylyltransferase [Candidatus Obscuribacterales bacterium]|nr:2-C-methyl-D-erythritol 4-phosphate cytidylyltransferase [Candidatus Obscuribacterales bacterium]
MSKLDRTNKSGSNRFSALVAAAGTGSRFSSQDQNSPKQTIDLCGYPLYIWSLISLSTNDDINKVVLVTGESMLKEMTAQIDEIFTTNSLLRQSKKITVVTGGKTRQESVYQGLLSITNEPPEFVLVHDAARPFLTNDLIAKVLQAVTARGACTLAVPVADTIKRVVDGSIERTLDRSLLYAAHTPQAARYDWLLKAHKRAAREGREATDDAMLLEQDGHQVAVVESSRYNLKVTIPEDLVLAKSFADEILGQINDYARAHANIKS